MEWSAKGIVLSVRKHSERDVILEVMTDTRGRHLGLVRGGRSKRLQPFLQPGNELDLTWRARLIEHLGVFSLEPGKLNAADYLSNAFALHALQHICGLLRLLPERQEHPRLFSALNVLLEHLNEASIAAPLIIKFELETLRELGFGLDLESCAATGITHDLGYVSPKSGRAVSRDAGRPYHDKLFTLPPFLADGERQPGSEITFDDLKNGFLITSFFLNARVLEPRELEGTLSRENLLASLEKGYRAAFPWNFASTES
ncbi:MAG: DNA repair protein RecO [Rhodobacteraceae bacterium]|nr:DNA repair protein RecO [Paracoccaceae bacterium]